MRGLKLVPLLKREGRHYPIEQCGVEVGCYLRGEIDGVMVVTMPIPLIGDDHGRMRHEARKQLQKIFPDREIIVVSEELKFWGLREDVELPIETAMRRLRGID